MVVFAKRLNNQRKETVPVAVQANTARLKVTKETRCSLIAHGRGRNRWRNARNPRRDYTTPRLLVDGVVSSTGSVSTGVSSMFSRMDWARW